MSKYDFVPLLQEIISESDLMPILARIAELNLPECWLAGGAVRNTVWKKLFADNCLLAIKDYDIAFFDRSGNREQEAEARGMLQRVFPDAVFDVKNQASFGVWRNAWRAFDSSSDAISNWLHTATATGVRLNKNGQLEILSPYGLLDLFAGVIRITPHIPARAEADRKAEEYLSKCPLLYWAS